MIQSHCYKPDFISIWTASLPRVWNYSQAIRPRKRVGNKFRIAILGRDFPTTKQPHISFSFHNLYSTRFDKGFEEARHHTRDCL